MTNKNLNISLIIIISTLLISSCKNSETNKGNSDVNQIKLNYKEGYYLTKEYLNFNFKDEESPNAIGINISKSDSIFSFVDFNCQECMTMGDNWTTSKLLSESEFGSLWSALEINNKFALVAKLRGGKNGDTLYWISKENFKILNNCQFDFIEKELNKYKTLLFNKIGKLEFNNGNCFPVGCFSNVSFSIDYVNNFAKVFYMLGDEEYKAEAEIFINTKGEEMLLLKNIINIKNNAPKDNKIVVVEKNKESSKKITLFLLDEASIEKVENEKDINFDNYSGAYFQNFIE